MCATVNAKNSFCSMAMRFVPALTDSNREKERGQLCDRHPTLKFIGNLDTTTASEPESTLMAVLRGARNGAGLPRTGVGSSAGLRVILKAHKLMSAQRAMKLTHVNKSITEAFGITGFADILTIK